jgi:predicted nicotinamide N-methyase
MNLITDAPAPRISPQRFRQKLLRRIHQRWETLQTELRFGPAVLNFTRIADPNRVLDDAVAEEDRRQRSGEPPLYELPHLPYWAELWESGGALADCLARTPPPPGARVLDLGCGMGLCGAVAAALGANVLLVDLEPSALLLARLNTLDLGDRVRVRRLDWRRDCLDEEFDLILGADIIYERGQWEFLDEFFRRHLGEGGSVWLSEPGRQSGEAFVPWITGRGWTVAEEFVSGGKIRVVRLGRGH